LNLAAEQQVRISAEKRERDQELEDEQMRMIYGPNWRSGLPSWAYESSKARGHAQSSVRDDHEDEDEDYADEEDDEDEEVNRVATPRRSGKRPVSR
jgi:hypothetical protein